MNPTGVVYTIEEVEKLSLLFKEYNVLVISDEIYNNLVYSIYKTTSVSNYYSNVIIYSIIYVINIIACTWYLVLIIFNHI